MNKISTPRTTVAEFLADKMAASDLTQREIAEACGFDKPNIITMFKNGQTKLPINRIAPLAKVLGIDPVHLLRLVMSEYLPETWEAIEDILQSTLLSANELQLVRSFREVTGDINSQAVVIDRNAVLAIVTA